MENTQKLTIQHLDTINRQKLIFLQQALNFSYIY